EGRARALAVLAPPEVLQIRRRGPVPALAVLFIERDLAEARVHEPRQVLRHESEGLVEVDRARDRLADVRDQLQLLGVALRLLIKTRGLDRHRELTGCRPQGLDLAPVRAP